MKRWMVLLGSLLFLPGAAPQQSPPVEIREWPVPWKDTRPRDPAVDGQGRVWFVGQTGDYIARFGTDKGTVGRALVATKS